MRRKPRIYLDRDSCCFGEDTHAPHEEEWILRPEHNLVSILNLTKNDYLPTNIQGDNPGWVAKCKDIAIAVIGQKWHSAKLIDPTLTLESMINENGDIKLFFEYLNDKDPDHVFEKATNA